MSENATVRTKIKEIITTEGLNMGSDVQDKLDEKIRLLIKEACDRAKNNARRTLQARDF